MNPNHCRIELRPRGPFEVLDLALRLTRVRWWPLFQVGAGLLLPLFLACTGLCVLTDGHWSLVALPILFAPVLQAPFTLLVGRLLFADEVSLRALVPDLLRRSPALAASWLVIGMSTVALGTVTCGYGVPLAQAASLYMTEATLLEQVDLGRAANRSLRLAGASAGQSLAGLVVRWGLLIWFGLCGEAVGQGIVGFVLQLGEPFGSLGVDHVTPYFLGGLLLSQPAWAIYRVLLYVDVRTRTEGWDLQVGLWAAGQNA